MKDLTITLVQADQIWEDKTANFLNYEQLLSDTAETDLILLPEMFNTGFSMNASALAEKMESSVSIEWLKTISQQKQAAIIDC
jgi:omega-amidase